MKYLLLAAAALLMLAPAHAQENGDVMIGASGECSRDIACSGAFLTLRANGRMVFNVLHDDGAVMFAGNENPNSTETSLVVDVDVLRFGYGDGTGDAYEVTGRCVMTVEGSPAVWNRLFCSVFNSNDDNFVIMFKGDDKPMQIIR